MEDKRLDTLPPYPPPHCPLIFIPTSLLLLSTSPPPIYSPVLLSHVLISLSSSLSFPTPIISSLSVPLPLVPIVRLSPSSAPIFLLHPACCLGQETKDIGRWTRGGRQSDRELGGRAVRDRERSMGGGG